MSVSARYFDRLLRGGVHTIPPTSLETNERRKQVNTTVLDFNTSTAFNEPLGTRKSSFLNSHKDVPLNMFVVSCLWVLWDGIIRIEDLETFVMRSVVRFIVTTKDVDDVLKYELHVKNEDAADDIIVLRAKVKPFVMCLMSLYKDLKMSTVIDFPVGDEVVNARMIFYVKNSLSRPDPIESQTLLGWVFSSYYPVMWVNFLTSYFKHDLAELKFAQEYMNNMKVFRMNFDIEAKDEALVTINNYIEKQQRVVDHVNKFVG